MIAGRKLLLGTKERTGLLSYMGLYGILLGMGFVFIYPMLYMISTSFMDTKDLVDATVAWIPHRVSLEGFARAARTLHYWEALRTSLIFSLFPALLQTITLAFAGYGLGRFEVPLKKVWIGLIVLVFLVPSAVTLIPRYMLFNSYGMINTVWPTMITALGGQGVKSSLFLLIYYQFFSSYPKALDEAAMIDGAGRLDVFLRVAIPLAIPAIVVAFLFSFVWFWNETTQLPLLSGTAARTLPIQLREFASTFMKYYPDSDVSYGGALNESIRLAGTLLSIAPLLVLYLFLQNHFVQSIERTGIAGE